jgi:RecA-family ATPase
MSDALTSRAAREYRDERDRQERTKGGPRLAVLHSAPPPQSEEDYDGAHAPFAPLDEAAPEREPSELGRPPRAAEPDWLIDPTAWEGIEVPQREWIVPMYVPHPTVTLLYGDGAVGKSLLGLQLGAARALAREWIGLLPEPGRTIYFSAEDDADEMHRRLDDIRRFYGVTWAQIGEGLRLRDNVGADAVLCGWNRTSISPSSVMTRLIEHIDAFGGQFVIIDTLADAYPGDENDRAQARQFIGLLKQVARTRQSSFLVLAHPSLTGLNTGRGTSGSTGWSNSVRSRLYFQVAKATDGSEPDKNLRTLEGMKSNYGVPGGKVDLEWKNGLFVPVQGPTGLDKIAREKKAENAFLDLLKEFAGQGRNVNANKGPTYAPAIFAKEESARGVKREELENAMGRLLKAKTIQVEQFGPASKLRTRLVIAGTSQ